MNLSYMGFRLIEPKDAEMMIKWRTKQSISQYMLTEISPDPALQRQWIEKNAQNPSLCHRILQIHQQDVGYVAIKITDSEQKIGSVGIYIGDDSVDRILTSFNFIPTLNQAFFVLDLKKIHNQILSHNNRIIQAQQFNGYKLLEVKEEFITKYNQRYDAYVFEQTKEEWQQFSKKFKWSLGFD